MTEREHLLAYIRFEGDRDYPALFFTGPSPYTLNVDTLICERPQHSSGYDAFGVHWTHTQPTSHRTPGQEPILSDIEDWDQVKVPDVSRFDWDGLARQCAGLDRPELWRETIRPHTQRIYDAVHDRGMLVCQHSCGQISALIPDLIEMGADLWEAQVGCYELSELLAQCAGKLRVICPDLARKPGDPPPGPPPVTEEFLRNLPQDARAYERYPDFLI